MVKRWHGILKRWVYAEAGLWLLLLLFLGGWSVESGVLTFVVGCCGDVRGYDAMFDVCDMGKNLYCCDAAVV